MLRMLAAGTALAAGMLMSVEGALAELGRCSGGQFHAVSGGGYCKGDRPRRAAARALHAGGVATAYTVNRPKRHGDAASA